MCPAEVALERSWFLTRAHVSAGNDELSDVPGGAGWTEWLSIVLVSASHAVETGCECRDAGSPEFATPLSEYSLSSREQYECAAGGLLTACLQALVLFDAAPGKSPPSDSNR